MNKNFQNTLNYLYSKLPVFQQSGATALRPGLTNILSLLRFLGNPHEKFKSIHIGGTNGKGSSSHCLSAILQSSGYKVGLYTSPHLKSFLERIKINGKEVDNLFIIEFVDRMKFEIERISPSFFEVTVTMAFEYFAQQKVDIAVVEVGMGGRLDSTNVITPELSLITNIGWDHHYILGDTLEKIATEKAGIIKPSIPIVISERQQSIDQVFIKKAKSTNSPLFFASDEFHASFDSQYIEMQIGKKKGGIMKLKTPLKGKYQEKNILGVLKAVEVLNTLDYGIYQSKRLVWVWKM